jgi:SNF2 family DNA or RNA helicase
LIIQINTGGQGINLQEATRIHITCPTWNPALEYQAIGRAHRTGQTKEVHVTKYILSDPEDTEITYIEEKILELHDKKKEVISDVLQDPRIKDSNTFNFNKVVKVSGTDLKKLFRK